MASFVAHRSRIGSSRPSTDGALLVQKIDSLVIRGIWGIDSSLGSGNRPAVKPIWSGRTLHIKENEMKCIGTLSGMRWLMLSLIFQTTYIAAVVAQEINEAPSPIQLTFPANVSPDYWTGRIEQDTTWRDTVYVSGDVTIASGATLTLAPGTQVHFLPYRDDTQGGLDSTRAELIVEGRLHAQAEGIVFGSANAASLGADWYGIVVERGGLADVSNATIRDGRRCLYAKRGGHVRMDHVAFANCGKQTGASLFHRYGLAASDSLSEQMEVMVRRYYKKATNRDALRIAKKVAAGTASGIVFTGAAMIFLDERESNGFDTLAYLFGGLLFGTTAGFPIGVTLVDPYDSLPITLLAGVIPGSVGIGLIRASHDIGFLVAYVGPIICSLYASEKWHQSFQNRRVSFGLAPTLNGGLSAVTTLRF